MPEIPYFEYLLVIFFGLATGVQMIDAQYVKAIGTGIIGICVVLLFHWMALVIRKIRNKSNADTTPLMAFKSFIYKRIDENLKIRLYLPTFINPTTKYRIALSEMQDWRYLVAVALKMALGEEEQKKFLLQGGSLDPLSTKPDAEKLLRLFDFYRNSLTKIYNETVEVKNFNPRDLMEYDRNHELEPKQKAIIFKMINRRTVFILSIILFGNIFYFFLNRSRTEKNTHPVTQIHQQISPISTLHTLPPLLSQLPKALLCKPAFYPIPLGIDKAIGNLTDLRSRGATILNMCESLGVDSATYSKINDPWIEDVRTSLSQPFFVTDNEFKHWLGGRPDEGNQICNNVDFDDFNYVPELGLVDIYKQKHLDGKTLNENEWLEIQKRLFSITYYLVELELRKNGYKIICPEDYLGTYKKIYILRKTS